MLPCLSLLNNLNMDGGSIPPRVTVAHQTLLCVAYLASLRISHVLFPIAFIFGLLCASGFSLCSLFSRLS